MTERSELGCELAAEESHKSSDALFLGNLGDVCRRFNANGGDAAPHEKLQQIAVVACDLNNLTLCRQPKLVDHLVNVTAAMIQPRVRKGREVGILGEYLTAADVLLYLHEVASVADPHMERI